MKISESVKKGLMPELSIPNLKLPDGVVDFLKSGGNCKIKSKEGSKIHIKKKNRGKFTDYCGGTVTSECIARGKRSSSPTIRKRATFAANARKWKHQYGGNIIPGDFQPLVDKVNQPMIDNIKQQEYNFNVKDYAYRAKKLHPEVTEQQVAAVYNSIPMIASSRRPGRKMGSYNWLTTNDGSESNHRIMVYPNNVNQPEGSIEGWSKENALQDIISHETNHSLLHNLFKNQYTPEEEGYLKSAYEGIFNSNNLSKEQTLQEMRATNQELRRRISRDNGNVTGKDLDKVIDKLSDNNLMWNYFNQSGYTTDDYNGTLKKNAKDITGKWNKQRVNNIKSALKNVAFNNNRFSSPLFVQAGGIIKAGQLAKKHLTSRKNPDWDNMDRGYRYLTQDMGMDHNRAIALMGNVVEESQGDYKAKQKNGGGKGLIQWDGRPAPSGRYSQWGSIWASVTKKANRYNPETGVTQNYWAPWNGLKGEEARKKFNNPKTPIKTKTQIYAESYLRPGKPRIADRKLSSMQLDSIYNPNIKNITVRLKKKGGSFKIPGVIDSNPKLDNMKGDYVSKKKLIKKKK